MLLERGLLASLFHMHMGKMIGQSLLLQNQVLDLESILLTMKVPMLQHWLWQRLPREEALLRFLEHLEEGQIMSDPLPRQVMEER